MTQGDLVGGFLPPRPPSFVEVAPGIFRITGQIRNVRHRGNYLAFADIQAGEELPFSKDEVPALNSASHTQDDSSPQKLLMHTQLMAQNNDCKSPKADDLSDQELNDACTSTVAETPVVQLIFSAKDYLVTTNRNQTVTETTGPSPKFSDSQHDKRDDNTLMAVASCMGYNSVLEFDICMRLLSYLRSSPNFFAYSRILRLYENGRLISYFACRGLDLSSDDAESLFALTKTAQKDILVKRARVAAGRPLVRCRKQLLSQADFAILDQAIRLQRGFQSSSALEWAYEESPATLNSHDSDGTGDCTGHSTACRKCHDRPVEASEELLLSSSVINSALADLPPEKMERRRLKWISEKKTPQVTWIVQRARRLYDLKVKHVKSDAPFHIVDVGGGRGDLALTLAAALPTATVMVVDTHEPSLTALKYRAELLGQTRIQVVHGDFLNIEDLGTPDLFVALHACGGLSDAVLSAALDKKASFIVSGCCFCKYPALRESTLLPKLLMAVPAARERRVCLLCAPFVHMIQFPCCHNQSGCVNEVIEAAQDEKCGDILGKRIHSPSTVSRLCDQASAGSITDVCKMEQVQRYAQDDMPLRNLLRLDAFPARHSQKNLVLLGQFIDHED